MKATELRCDHKRDPIGIGGAQPLLSWQLSAEGYGDAQSAVQVQAAASPDGWDRDLLWDSGIVRTPHCGMVYGGPALGSNTLAYWRVRVWDASGACVCFPAE